MLRMGKSWQLEAPELLGGETYPVGRSRKIISCARHAPDYLF